MKNLPKRLPVILTLVAVAAGLTYALWPRPIAVEVALVTRGPMQVTVNDDGKTRIKERYVVSTPIGGRIRRIELHPGDPVEAGKTLLTSVEPTDPELLDPRTLAQAEARARAAEAAQSQAGASLERARTAHDFERTEMDRATKLFRDKLMSRQDFDRAEQRERVAAEECKSAEFGLQIANFELEQAKAALLTFGSNKATDDEGFAIRSPIHGRLLRVFQESSAVVPPGARLMELGDPTDLEVEVDVLSTDAVKIKPGANVTLEHWGGGAPLLGHVRLVEPAAFLKVSALGVEEQRVNVIVDFTTPATERANLGDAYQLEARIVVWESANALKVPTSALFRQGADWAVFAIAGNRARLRVVTIGQINDLEAELLSGLEESERVIPHPSDKLYEGVTVETP